MLQLKQAVLLLVFFCLSAAVVYGQEPGDPAADAAKNLVQAGMSEDAAARLVADMVGAQYGVEAMERVVQQVRLAEGHPQAVAAIASKVSEGIAKRVGVEAMVQAAIRVRERHAFAQRTAGNFAGGKRSEMESVVADSLASGLTPADTGQIAASLQSRRQAFSAEQFEGLALEALTTARDMARLGVRSQTTSAAVNLALAKGYDEANMQLLRQAFNAQRTQTNMEAVAQRLMHAIGQGVSPGQLKGYGQPAQAGSGDNSGKGSSGGGSGSGSGNGGGSGGSGGSGGGNGGGKGGGRGGK